ncbi:MAG: hypothetical protein M0R47_01130 [Methylobacter sp.]|uniref:hypothetical protein n=1 Tax=Methylobacter sp. TaxID=2051955 RepID=UPI0025FBC75A|nr:hypothetical protein [Methylobacter sp.]MCK9619117.1 hypothetical protein [Methylobacter sp.]
MQELSERELFEALHYAKSIDQETGAKILQQFQIEQAALAQTLFCIFPAFIAEQHQDMAHLFMDLCFDALCVFQHAFGPLPSQSEMDVYWLEKQSVLLDAELQSLIQERPMDDKIRSKLQDRYARRSQEETAQRGLVNFMKAAIEDFASEDINRAPAIKITQTMLLIAIRLFSNLYRHANRAA